MVKAEKLIFEYDKRDKDGNIIGANRAIDQVDLDIAPGSFIAILGSNGSGKSTLAKHINALLLPTGGTIWVNGIDTKKPEELWHVRQSAGMVFQNPDNQIIGTVVEEDVGFGPENLGVPTSEIWQRVEDSLRSVNMLEYRNHSPNKLSGGQKQRVAIAGVIAMEPHCIVLDESTAMLDPAGRLEVLRSVAELRHKKKVTVIWITHYMEEVICADKVYVMDQGKIAMKGTPKEIFSQVERIKSYHLDVPQVTLLAEVLRGRGIELPAGIIEPCEFVVEIKKKVKKNSGSKGDKGAGCMYLNSENDKRAGDIPAIHLKDVNYTYGADGPYEKKALCDINLEILHGQMVGIIGHTGSGKSTLIQHLNGLLKATSGIVYYNGEDIYAKGYDRKKLRTQVGMVFQYPEHQLFEVDVISDVSYGPKNQGLSEEEARVRAIEALELVGFSEKDYHQSPFELSGGQKRRAAIAGVLAMKPKVLVLDEPTAGLDPKGRDGILNQIVRLHKQTGITVILVSHSMEDIARYVKRIIVMNQGGVLYDDKPSEVFSHYKALEKIGLAAPQVTYIMHDLQDAGFSVDTHVTTVEAAADELFPN
ncbi:MAG: energy-coupling factor transporter ATPase [Lachnospiraceae bacterium]|nr:energy-coupling factor transporter ATPase [Lachnospiraceae bacterium]